MEILMLPKEGYPLQRNRLKELFFKELTRLGINIKWVLVSDDADYERKVGNNHLYLLRNRYNNPISRYIVNNLLRIRKIPMSIRIMKQNKIDLIVANDGILEGTIALVLSRYYGIPYAFYLSSLFEDMVKNEFSNHRSLKNFLVWIKELMKLPLRNMIIRRSTLFHPISRSMGEYYSEKLGKDEFHTLPLCPPGKFLDEDIRNSPKKNGIVRMIYIGQITPVRNIEFMIRVLKGLNGRDRIFELELVGKIFNKDYRGKIIKLIDDLDLKERVNIVSEVPIEKIPERIKSADIGLCLLPPIKAYRVSSPTKVVEYLALGIPAVGNREIDDQMRIIMESKGGVSPEYDVDKVVEAIYDLISEDGYHEKGLRGRNWILRNRNYELMAKSLKQKYESKFGNQ